MRLRYLMVTLVGTLVVLGLSVGTAAQSEARSRCAHPSTPRLTVVGVPNGVRFTWTSSAHATRYRVQWAPVPFDQWPGPATYVSHAPGGWVGGSVRTETLTFTAPHAGDRMMGYAYGNPAFARVFANNACSPRTQPHSGWVGGFPTAPAVPAGDPLRIGTYNVELFPNETSNPTRIAAIAQNISSHGLEVVTLQEAHDDTGTSVLGRLPGSWARVASHSAYAAQQILYRSDKFRLVDAGSFNVPLPGRSDQMGTPWARLAPVNPAGPNSQDFFVVSVHLGTDKSKSLMTQKHDAGINASIAIRNIRAINPSGLPLMVTGDLIGLRSPYGDQAGYVEAQPTFIRSGFFDSRSAPRRAGIAYGTVNGHKRQFPMNSGAGTRSDYILFQGYWGGRTWTNVSNWPGTSGVTPTDHNLVFADVSVPFAG